MGMDALAGIRICDFSVGAAGPIATQLLGSMGAEVIKVESMRRPDFSRLRINPLTRAHYGINRSPGFNEANYNKLSVSLNLVEPKAIDVAKKLIKISDVVVEGFKPGVMERLGLGYEVIKQIKPHIIMLSTSTSGQGGPEASYMGYAPVFGAISGLSNMTGYPDEPPSEIRGTNDWISAHTAAFAVMAALIHHQRTGEGQHVDLSSREVLLCLLGDSIMDYTMNGQIQSRHGNRNGVMAPHNCYRCKGEDRWVSIAIATEDEWRGFCKAIGNPAWVQEKRFSDQHSRWQNQEELDKEVEKWTVNYSSFDVMQILQDAGVAAIPSFTAQDIYSDPHLDERGLTSVFEHQEVGAFVAVNCPWKMSETPAQIRRPAPLLGENNEYVLGNLLGMYQEQIRVLEVEKVVY